MELHSKLAMDRCRIIRAAVILFFGVMGALFITHAPAAAAVFFANPVIAGDHPDPSIIRVGKEYWATCTSSEWGPMFPLLHSTDLVNWEQSGAVLEHRPPWTAGNFWAPEISEHQGRFYVYYAARQKHGPLAVAVATADKPAGPYTDHGPIVAQPDGSIDPAPCDDEKGRRYLIWKEDGNSIQKPTPIWAQPLDESGTKLTGQPKELIRNDTDWEGNVVEGPFVLRRGDWFYLFYSGNGCCGAGCHYALGVARARALLGPWEKNPANPILTANERWKCPGHGSIVTDDQGRYWLLYHAYAARNPSFMGREAMLDQIIFGTNDWPTINNGDGPGIKTASPFGVVQKKAQSNLGEDFSGERLNPGWEWPQNNEPRCRFQNGHLFLSKANNSGTNFLGAVLTRPPAFADYTATVVLDTASLASGCAAGLAVYHDRANALGMAVRNGKLTLWSVHAGKFAQLAEMPAPIGKKIQLRLISGNGSSVQFAASADGHQWLPVGENALERGGRFALTVGGTKTAEAEFDSVRILASTPD